MNNVRSVRFLAILTAVVAIPMTLRAIDVTYQPYIQPGDAGPFGASDQIVIVWQTDETVANPGAYSVWVADNPAFGSANKVMPVGRVVDNYLAADPTTFGSLTIATAYGAHTDYYALAAGLRYNAQYFYKVIGPGMPGGGFSASFHTQTQHNNFSFQVQGDEGYFPGIPNTNPVHLADYEARIIHTMFDVDQLSLSGQPKLPRPDFALNTGDNVYVDGSDSNYHDVWFRSWSGDTDSNETGAPFIRSIPLYIVVGNHDVGSTGVTANLLAANPRPLLVPPDLDRSAGISAAETGSLISITTISR